MTGGGDWLPRRIDYLLVSGIDVGEMRVLDESLSDHRPLTATFSFSPQLAAYWLGRSLANSPGASAPAHSGFSMTGYTTVVSLMPGGGGSNTAVYSDSRMHS
jgi:hypothetical protein